MSIEPVLYSKDEIELLRGELGRDSLMGRTIEEHKKSVDAFIALPLDVPGHGEAGGYEHNRHKQNYHYMYLAGSLFLITRERKYFDFVAQLLDLYADKYLTFGFHVQKNTNPTGRLFHQILNEHCWLLFTSLAYSCVASEMSFAQRNKIATRVFEPMLDMFTNKYGHDFDRIHNHGIWAVAAVGVCGLVVGKREYLEKSVMGLENNGTGGFLAQISQLFSPSGYYMEGPYYHRYAIHPVCLFSEVLHRWMPELDIFNYKGGVVGTTVKTLLASAYPNGVFPPLNDASRTMSVTDAGVQVAVSLYAKHYENDTNLVRVANLQGQVWLHGAGVVLSQQHEEAQKESELTDPNWPSVELTEGPEGESGAIGILRHQAEEGDISQLIMSYGQHGMGHGHFDTLGITFFNRGQEVLQDYGYVRWVNVEPKFGGRYLAENVSYARHTIAHNGVTIDQKSQNNFDVKRADSVHGEGHFFSSDDANCLAMGAFANEHYDGVKMQRSCFLITVPEFEAPVLVDIYRLISDDTHSFDYSHQYEGQIVRTNFDVNTEKELHPWGEAQGYQHLWKRSSGQAPETALVSWLQNNTYYSWLGTSSNANDEVIFTTTGANDPSFNMRNEDAFTLRSQGGTTVFASALETHGYFNEEFEQSTNARGLLKSIRIVGHDDLGTVVELATEDKTVTVVVSNQATADEETKYELTFEGKSYNWTGCYGVEISPATKEELV